MGEPSISGRRGSGGDEFAGRDAIATAETASEVAGIPEAGVEGGGLDGVAETGEDEAFGAFQAAELHVGHRRHTEDGAEAMGEAGGGDVEVGGEGGDGEGAVALSGQEGADLPREGVLPAVAGLGGLVGAEEKGALQKVHGQGVSEGGVLRGLADAFEEGLADAAAGGRRGGAQVDEAKGVAGGEGKVEEGAAVPVLGGEEVDPEEVPRLVGPGAVALGDARWEEGHLIRHHAAGVAVGVDAPDAAQGG